MYSFNAALTNPVPGGNLSPDVLNHRGRGFNIIFPEVINMPETTASQPEKSSETPVADFLKRNPQAHPLDLFLFATDLIPLRTLSLSGGDRAAAALVNAVADKLATRVVREFEFSRSPKEIASAVDRVFLGRDRTSEE